MKRYVPIIIGIVALCAVLYVGNNEMKNRHARNVEKQSNDISFKSFQGKVTREFEGENVLGYGFDVPEGATTTVEKDGALVKVADENESPIVAMYFSFEGGRGYSPADYITNVIVPKVAAITEVGTTTIGDHEWDVVESEWTVWHVAKSASGAWLLVVESPKSASEKAEALIKSIVTK